MPADNGSRCHQDQRLFPSSPEPSQYHPEQLLRCRESPTWPLAVKNQQLLTQGNIFEDKILASGEGTAKPLGSVGTTQSFENVTRRSPNDSSSTH